MLTYTRSFAQHHTLYVSIQFNAAIQKAPPDAKGWKLDIEGRETPLYCDNLIVATGNYWCPRMPNFS